MRRARHISSAPRHACAAVVAARLHSSSDCRPTRMAPAGRGKGGGKKEQRAQRAALLVRPNAVR